ncbi:MAG: thioredoxin family protein [Candidatus Woesearchaeota archaeon]
MVLTESGKKLKIGDRAPDFSLKGVDGNSYSLKDFRDKKAVLIIFMCNHCPYVKIKIDAIKKLQEDFKENIQVIGINSNDPEYDSEDSFENMKKYAKEGSYNFIYLFDEDQDIAKAYGASCTPDPFLFKNRDGGFELFYHGRINDGMEPGDEVKVNDMHGVIHTLIEGRSYDKEVFPSIGCSIKWK